MIQTDNRTDQEPHFLLRYSAAVLAVVLMTLLRLALRPLLGDNTPFITYFAAVVFSTLYGGLGPGAVAVLLGAATAWWLFIPPPFSFTLRSGPDFLSLFLFLLVGGGIALMGEIQRRTQKKLRRSQQWLATTLASIGDAVLATDLNANVTYLNPVAERLTGWPQEQAVGRPITEVFVIINEESRQQTENPVLRVLETGVQTGLANHTLLVARDGTERPIDDSAAPIRVGDQLLGAVLVFRDITERRQTERAVRESEERFRILAEVMPQFVWVSDPAGKVEYVNKRWTEYTGQTSADTGPENAPMIHPEDVNIMFDRWSEARAKGVDYEVEFRCRSIQDREYRWFLARGVPIRNEEGAIVRWIGTSTDIQRQKEAEAEISRLNMRLHRSLYESSHRIKNHLQTLAATVDIALLEGRELLPAAEVQRLGMQIRTLSALQDILTIEWKADRSGAIETISSRALLEKVLETLQQAFPTKQIRYSVEDIALSVKAATSLSLLINETVSNAIKHGGGTVEVTFRRSGEYVFLETQDDGPGFPPGFDPVRFANTGLELIESLVVHDLGGTAVYRNREPRGAHVSVSFPSPLFDQATR